MTATIVRFRHANFNATLDQAVVTGKVSIEQIGKDAILFIEEAGGGPIQAAFLSMLAELYGIEPVIVPTEKDSQ